MLFVAAGASESVQATHTPPRGFNILVSDLQ